jgi:excisionase family DNA binding protein
METLSYTPEEVARLLKVTRFTVYEMIKRGDFPAYRIGRKMRIEAGDVAAYIKKSKGDTRPAASILIPEQAAASAAGGNDHLRPDPVLDSLTRHLGKQLPQVRILRNYVVASTACRRFITVGPMLRLRTFGTVIPTPITFLMCVGCCGACGGDRQSGVPDSRFFRGRGNPLAIRDWPTC